MIRESKKFEEYSLNRIVRVCGVHYSHRIKGQVTCKEYMHPNGDCRSYRKGSFIGLMGNRSIFRILRCIVSCFDFGSHRIVGETEPHLKETSTNCLTREWMRLFRKIVVFEDINFRGFQEIVEEDEMLVNNLTIDHVVFLESKKSWKTLTQMKSARFKWLRRQKYVTFVERYYEDDKNLKRAKCARVRSYAVDSLKALNIARMYYLL